MREEERLAFERSWSIISLLEVVQLVDDHQGVSIKEAAKRLDISENAVRQRIKRGSLTSEKINGRWSVLLVEDYYDVQPDHNELVKELRNQVSWLKEELRKKQEEYDQAVSRHAEEIRRRDTIMLDLQNRLPAPDEKVDDEQDSDQTQRQWWRFWDR